MTHASTSNPYQISFKELDTFYFKEFVPSLHPILQPLATDLRVLRHETDEKHIATVERLYKVHVGFIPWLLDDIFDVPPDHIITLGKGWIATFIDIAMTDSVVDRELPDDSLITLLQQQIRLSAEKQYRLLFADNSPFWTNYADAYIAGLNGLAHEAYCTDMHQEPYTIEAVDYVYEGKGAVYRLMVKAMALLSGQTEITADIERVYHQLAMVDQLLDDASDWREDFVRGHITSPIILTIEAADYPFNKIDDLTPQELEGWIFFHDILTDVANNCVERLEESTEILNNLGLADTKIAHFVAKRLRVVQSRKKQFQTLRKLKAFLVAFHR